MSDLESGSQYSVHQGAIHESRANRATWREVLKNAMHQSTWIRNRHSQGSPGVEMQSSVPTSPRRNSKWTTWGFFGVIILLSFPIAFVIIHYIEQPAHLKQSPGAIATSKSLLGLSSDAAKPKPAPGKPFVPVPETHFTNPTVLNPPPSTQTAQNPAVVPQGPVRPALNTPPQSQVATPSSPQSIAPAKAPFASIIYPAHHDKHFGGCTGQLTLSATGLNFRCAEDPGGSFQVGLNEVGAIDDNGIATLSGKKYHFTISGVSKPATRQLFANWLHQVR